MARRKSLTPLYEVVAEHRRRLDRVAERRALPRLKRLYDEAHASIADALRRRLRAGLGDTFTAQQQRVMLAQLRIGQARLAGMLAGELSDATVEAQLDTVRSLAKGIANLERHFTGAEVSLPIEEAWKLRELVTARRPELDLMHQRSMARWGARLFADVHEQTSLALVTDATTEQAIEMIPKTAAAEWWQGERIVRTETAWATNSAAADGIREAVKTLPDLRKRWTEHVDDETGTPFDDRVSPDSLVMHGQVAGEDGLFWFPSNAPGMDAREIERMQERSPWEEPPNRPNDRASIQPWRPGWGIPAWELRDGMRVQL